MHNETRVVFNALLARQAQLNGIPSAEKAFSITPAVQQTLENRIQESSEFLSQINVIGVRELKGEKLLIGVDGPIASRTNTENSERQTRAADTMAGQGYECAKTNYDTHIRYAKLDAWAGFPDFQNRVRDSIVKRQALDRIMIGFNGTSVAADTDRGANPLLQDVNIGWLQHIREDAPARVMDEAGTAGKIIVGTGAGADYRNLDALVYDAYRTHMDPWHTESGELVAITGRGLMHDKLFPLVSNPEAPTEMLAADIVRSQRRLGGLPAVSLPFFPPDAVLVTSFKNLSIYWQKSARRRHIFDNPKRDRIENYESSNDAFVVEDYGMCALIENIELQPA